MKKQAAPQGVESKPAGRVAELVKGLLASRNIEMARMDRDTLEKLRVRGSGSSHASNVLALCQPSPRICTDLRQPQT